MEECIFCKIIKGEIPSEKVYEDGEMMIIKDVNPEAAIHLLLLPKQHFANIVEMTEEQGELIGRCLKKLGELTDSLGLQGGFRLGINKGSDACQSVNHLHIHILGGEQLSTNMA